MTKKLISLLLCFLLIFSALGATADESPSPVSVSHRYLDMTTGDSMALTLVSNGTGTQVVSLEGGDYISYENGTLFAKSAGRAVLTLLEMGPDSVLYQGVVVVTVAAAPEISYPTTASFASSSYSLQTGSSVSVSLSQDSAQVPTYLSTDDSVISLSNFSAAGCTVTALSAGSATLKAVFPNGKEALCTITVSAPAPALTLSLTHNPSTFLTRETYDFTVKDGSGNVVSGASVTSSNSSLVSVSSSRLSTGTSSGTATLTATYQGVSSAPFTVTVLPEPQSLSLSASTITLNQGSTYNLSPILYPSGAQTRLSYSVLSGSDVISVSSSGTVTAKKAGTGVVRISTHNGLQAALTVNVPSTAAPVRYVSISQNPLAVGSAAQITLVDRSAQTYPVSSYTSSNTAVAVVDGSGVVRGVSAGESTIVCTDAAGHQYSTTIKIYAAPSTITAIPSSSSLTVGQSTRINLSSDVALTFPYTVTSYNPAVVAVDSNDSLLLRAKSAGTATITVMAYNNKYATFQITVTGTAVTPVTPSSSTAIVVSDGRLNLRTAPSQSAGVILQIPQYSSVTVLTYGATWSYVRYNNLSGYVMTRYLSFASPSPTPTTPPPSGDVECYARVTTPSGSLNLRSAPNSYGSIMTRIPQNTYIDVLQRGVTWCCVSYNGLTGYVMTQFLTFSSTKPVQPSLPVTPGVSSTARVVTASGSLNLRAANHSSARILTRIPQFAYVTVINRGTTWSYVTYGGYTGYVMTQYLSFNLPTGSTTGNSGFTSSRAIVITPSGSLNLRVNALYGSTILTRIPQYASVTVLSRGSSWSKVSYGGFTGYVMNEFLRFL